MDLKFIRTLEMRTIESGGDAAAATMDKLATAHKGVATAAANTATVTETAAKSQKSLREQVDALEKRFNPLIRNQVEFEKVERRLLAAAAAQPELRERANATIQAAARHYDALSQAAVASGRATVDASKAVAGASNAFTSHAAGARLARHELINLSRQFQDVGVSLASGQSPLTVLVQQGSQIADVFATSSGTIRGFFSQVVGGAARFATSTAGIVTGLAGIAATAGIAAVGWSDSQRDIERSLSGIGRASGVTRDQINQIGKASSAAFGLSASEARTSAAAFAATGKIYSDNILLATRAVKDFARATGVDAADATKTLTKALLDPAHGALELDKTLGFLDVSTLNYIRTLQSQGNLQQAQNVLITALTPKIREMAEQTGIATKAWDVFGNVVSAAWKRVGRDSSRAIDALTGSDLMGGFSPDEQLANARKAQADALAQQARAQAGPKSFLQASPAALESTAAIKSTTAEVDRLEAAQKKLNATMEQSRFNQIAIDADNYTRALIPQIEALEKARAAQAALQKLRETFPGLDAFGGAAQKESPAEAAARLLVRTQQDSLEKQQRHTAEVLKTADAYKGVSIETALVLRSMDDQLAVASAVTGVERMAAQEKQRYNELVLEGVKSEEAALLAAKEREIKVAQVNSQAKATLLTLQDQFAVVSSVTGAERIRAESAATYNALVREGVSHLNATAVASQQATNAQAQINTGAQQQLLALRDHLNVSMAVTGQERIMAQGQATYNQLIRQGVDERLASAIAAQQEENAIAQINARVEEQIHGLRQQTALIEARARGEEDTVKAAQAYTNAIRAGASESQAAALGAATLRNALAQGAANASRLADEAERAANAYRDANRFIPSGSGQFTSNQGGGSQFNPAGYQSTSNLGVLYEMLRSSATSRFGGGGFTETLGMAGPTFRPTSSGLETIAGNALGTGGLLGAFESVVKAAGGVTQDAAGVLSRIVALAPDDKKPGLIKQQLALLQQQPGTLAREELIKSLNEQLKSLTESTDGLNGTLNSLLSPFFSQDPRTTKLGFRAGVVGNPDWMNGGSNENPLGAVTGWTGATGQAGGAIGSGGVGGYIGPDGKYYTGIPAVTGGGTTGGGTTGGGKYWHNAGVSGYWDDKPQVSGGPIGFAGGGSFTVPGGDSAIDNQFVAINARSGENISIAPPGTQPKTTTIINNNDNRIVIEGSVDDATFKKFKTSRFQQMQRIKQLAG